MNAHRIGRLWLAFATAMTLAAAGCEDDDPTGPASIDAASAGDAKLAADAASGDAASADVASSDAPAGDGAAADGGGDGAAADGGGDDGGSVGDGGAADAGTGDAPAGDGGGLVELACDVAIVGGGAGGLHSAFRLAPTLKQGVCLFEKEAELGGRIHDVPMNPADPNSPRFGTGARRLMEGQAVLFALATELGLTLEKAPGEADLISARGAFAFSKDALRDARYQSIKPDTDPDNDQETVLYDLLRKGPARANATSYPDFRSYIRDVAGHEEYTFLRDMSRFRADFEYPLDARGYLDYLDEEWDVCCEPSYPVGGMSAFIRGMEQKTTMAGARIFLSEPVASIAKDGAGYRLVTGKHTVKAAKLIIAAPPVAFDHMSGDVVERLKAKAEFQAIIGVPVVTVTQWWPSKWWGDIVNPALTMDNHVWRAWTTEHCVNFIEIPLDAYGAAQNVTRSVYDDDSICVEFWQQSAKKGTAAVEAEIKRGLTYLFNQNGVSSPAMVMVPNPTRTHVQIWPAAWHWVRAGAPYTNAQIFDWAVEPLAGENVALVGEAYHPQRSGWSDGAYKSSINLLNKKYGLKLSDGSAPAQSARLPQSKRRTRSQGGH